MPLSVKEAEARLYWHASTAARLKKRRGRRDLDEHIEEIEAIAINSDWRLLRTICFATIKTLVVISEASACES